MRSLWRYFECVIKTFLIAKLSCKIIILTSKKYLLKYAEQLIEKCKEMPDRILKLLSII